MLDGSIDALCRLARGRRIVALTGAGLSTESGIPDYRSPEALAKPRKPISGPEFQRSASMRRRYWARAVVGWERFSRAEPNDGHHALARLQALGVLAGLITQNVDGLHGKAGSRDVIELHGTLASVRCLECGAMESRASVQARLLAVNPGWLTATAAIAPDGDADLDASEVERFVVVSCERCGGVLKPAVVFFGDNVPKPVVETSYALVESAGLLLVAGTSLTVLSGYRFLVRAAERGIPVAIVNRGPVRGEERATLKVEASTSQALGALADAMSVSARAKGVSSHDHDTEAQ